MIDSVIQRINLRRGFAASRAWSGFAALAALASAARAELPPSVYGQEQRQAPYALELLVRSVHTSGATIEVQAQVLEVRRQPSGSLLKPGDRIAVVYPVPPSRPQGWVGPSPLPRVEPGEHLPAWLITDPNRPAAFKPAAGGRSFGPSLERQ